LGADILGKTATEIILDEQSIDVFIFLAARIHSG
jgi:hypothetical protein